MVLVLVVGLGSAVWSWVSASPAAVPVPSLQIEILNACGEDGLAQLASDHLLSLGHTVTRVADAGLEPLDRTLIVDRRGRDRLSRALARKIGPCPVILEQVENPVGDLTLILGADWEQLALFSGSRTFSGL